MCLACPPSAIVSLSLRRSAMLLVGSQRQRTCQGWTRRSFLQAGACSVFGLSLADLLRVQAAGGGVPGTARSVILLWLWGGPSHLETWDPKPGAPLEFRGPYSPIATRQNGVRICELFPKMAQLFDQCAIIRSMVSTSNDDGADGRPRAARLGLAVQPDGEAQA